MKAFLRTEAHQIDLSEAPPIPTFERHSGLSRGFDLSVAAVGAAAVVKVTKAELVSCSVIVHRWQKQEQNNLASQCFVSSHPLLSIMN